LIGKSLEAKVTLEGTSPVLSTIAENLETFRELLNVSQLAAKPGGKTESVPSSRVEGLEPGKVFRTTTGPFTFAIKAAKADGQKCERCWHWETDVGEHADHPTLCARCVRAVEDRKNE